VTAAARFASWFDSWVQSGPFTQGDAARFRIIFSVGALLTLFDFSWWGGFPTSMYFPPPGPFQLLPGLPPAWVGAAIEIAVALSFACLAFGYRTRLVSWSATLLMLLGFGLTYSFGKIDHPILFVIAPAVLSFTGWGGALSVDSARGLRSSGFQQWPLRLFAVLIGLGFFTAGFAKLRAGWLSPDTQASRREFLTAYVEGNRGGILPSFVTVDAPVIWEIVDWLTVALELGLVLCALSWTAFRVGIALTTLFHLSVMIMLTISFGFNVLAYGAFVQWSRVPLSAPAWTVRFVTRWWPALIPIIGLGLALLSHTIPHTAHQSGYFIFVGAGVGVGYLIYLVVRAASRRSNRHAVSPP